MRVHLFATLRALVGQKTVELPVAPGATAQALLDALLDHQPALRPQLVDADGALFGHVHLFINGRDVQHLPDAMATRLRGEDQVNVFPAVGGG
jgi:MoaD family protein